MSVSPKRLRVLPIVWAALVAAAVMAPAANAALAGAPAATTLLRPDLRSATLKSYDQTTGVAVITICYDQPIASVPDATKISAGTYNGTVGLGFGRRPADSAIRTSDSCLDATWNTADIEPSQRTFVTTLAGTVSSLTGGVTDANLSDSVALIGSNTHNGTKGHAEAPDLEGVQLVPAGNYVRYIFDQKVDPAFVTKTAINWSVDLQQGGHVTALDADADGIADDLTVSGNVVQVRFLPSAVFPPAPDRAVRANVAAGSVINSSFTAVNATMESATVPGTGGLTDNPDLVAIDVSDGDDIDFIFDETITPGANFNAAGALHIATSTSQQASGPAPWTIVNGNTIRVPFNLGNIHEYFVWGDVADNVVHSATTGNPNRASGTPAGGNAGAFATGFTTGPDAMRAAVDTTNGVVSIRLDQRFGAFVLGNIALVDDAGALIPGNPTAVSGAGGTAGQVIAQAQFTPGQVAGAKSLSLGENAFFTNLGVPNVDQQLAFSAAAKYAKKNGKAVWTHPSRKHATAKKAKAYKRVVARAFKRVR